jgi:hypothetical protein
MTLRSCMPLGADMWAVLVSFSVCGLGVAFAARWDPQASCILKETGDA